VPRRLTLFLLALSLVCFVVAGVMYEPPATGWTNYTPLSRAPAAGTDHWPWISAGAAFLLSAVAVAATGWAGRRGGG
jgi:heme/copper-type cytochrome/quinol oxidase subunit 1